MTSRICILILSLFIILFSAWAKCSWESKEALEAARNFEAQDKILEAISYYAQSIRWRAPFTSSWYEAQEKLISFSTKYPEHELSILRDLRGALRSSRSFLHPEETEETITRINQRLVEITGERKVIETYPPKVNYLMQIFSQATFFCFIASLVCAAWFGISANGALKRKPFVYALVGACISYTLWIFALSKA